MKSKNMTLMVVAIGCGLVAAFLTARLSSSSGPEMVDVWVAKKEITVGTVLDEKEFESLVVKTKMPKESLPQDVITNENDLKGKRVNRTLRPGNYFAPNDISAERAVPLPEGMVQAAIKTDVVRSAGGSVDAGKRVDIVLTETMKNGERKSSVIMYDMLILQVDQHQRPTEGPAGGRQQVGSVSLAVTVPQSQVLALAEARGNLSLNLRDKFSAPYKQVPPPPPGSITKIPGHDEDPKEATAVVEVKKVAVVVAKTDVPQNEFITGDNVDRYFTTRDIPEDLVTSKSIRDIASLREKFITKALEAEQYVFSSNLGDKRVEIPNKSVNPNPTTTTQPSASEQLSEMPREVVPPTPLYPRKFEQIINNQRIWFLETAPGQFRKLEGETPDLKNVPSTTGSTEEKKDKKPEVAGDRAA